MSLTGHLISPTAPQSQGEWVLMQVLRWVAVFMALGIGVLILNAWAGWWNQCVEGIRVVGGSEAACAAQVTASGVDGMAVGYVGFVLAIAPALLFGRTTYDYWAGFLALLSAGVGFLEWDGSPTGPSRIVAVVSFALLSVFTLALKEWVERATARNGTPGKLPSVMPIFGMLFAVAFIIALAVV